MSDAAIGGRLSIDADLQLSIDGVDATLAGDGDELTLRTDNPAQLSAALRRSGLFGLLRRVGEHADRTDVRPPSLTVEGPRGRVLRLDGGTRGILTRPLAGHTAVTVYRPQDLVPSAWRRRVAATLVALAVVAVWVRRRLRR